MDQTPPTPRAPKPIEPKAQKGAEAKKEVPDSHIEGFLVPRHFRNQSYYRNHPIFRSTLLVLIVGIAAGGMFIWQWVIANNTKRVAVSTQGILLQEAGRLQNQAALLKPIRDKYRELEVLRRQLRIPVAPIWDSIEKTIPEKISVNKITTLCPPTAATASIHRKTSVQIEVYFPPEISPTDEDYTTWPKRLGKMLNDHGLKMTKFDWGPQRNFNPSEDQAKKMRPDNNGATRDLNFTVELGSD